MAVAEVQFTPLANDTVMAKVIAIVIVSCFLTFGFGSQMGRRSRRHDAAETTSTQYEAHQFQDVEEEKVKEELDMITTCNE